LSRRLERAAEFDEAWLVAFKRRTPVGALARRLPYAAKLIAATVDDVPTIAFPLEGRLDLTGFSDFKAVIGLRGVNTRMPRSRFLTWRPQLFAS